MSKPAAVRDRLRGHFGTAIEHAYDLNDALAAFWLYAVQLADFEFRASGHGAAGHTLPGVLRSVELIDAQSFARGGLLGHEVAEITEIADKCEKIGITETAEALRLFSAVVLAIAADAPESCWCEHLLQELTCQACHYKARYLFWQVVNTKRRPDLRADARAGRLRSEARCYVCNNLIRKLHFFYCDPARDEFLVFWPYGARADADQVLKIYEACLDQMPLEMRDGKDRVLFVGGVPAVVFAEPDVAAITLCQSDEEFDQVVKDDLLFDVEPKANIEALDDHFAAKGFVNDRKWLPAAGAFARSFLKDPVGVSILSNVVSCLRNLHRDDEAEAILREAKRLHDLLLKHRIIKRVVRRSMGTDASGAELHARILSEGLPVDWGFADMLAQLRSIAEYGAVDSGPETPYPGTGRQRAMPQTDS